MIMNTIIVAVLIVLLVAFALLAFYLFYKLNEYITHLESKIEETLIITQNLKQSFRNVMIDSSFLLDDGKIKKQLIQDDKTSIYNGVNLSVRVNESITEI